MAKVSTHKRIKHGQLPGDIPKRDKIRMREERRGPGVRNWLKVIYGRSRAVLKRRARQEIERQLDDA